MLAKAREIEEARRIEEARKAEVEAKRRQEEEERLRLEEEERLKAEEEERRRLEEAEEDAISQLDNALKQTEEVSDDEEEDDEAFIERSPSIIDKSLELPYKESYLTMKEGGLLNLWKRHWCILRDETLMWFRAKLEALKAGWLLKKGGGTGTLSRRNWKRRWFVLKDTILTYHENDAEGAKPLGSIDLKNCQRILDSGEKENAFSIVTEGRTYHVIAESAHDWNQWFNVLNRVHRASEHELRDMKEESANIKHAIGTIDVPLIESCTLGGVPGKPNSFTIITADRLLSFCADTEDEADGWVDAIKKTKEREAEEGLADVVEQGWLIKEGPNDSRRKRWFVLTGNSLDYFKSYAKGSPRFGSIILNSLCSVIPPSSQDDAKEGDYIFTVNGRKRSYVIHAKSYEEATKWTSAIQDVIDTKLTIDTPFAKLMVEVKNAHDNEEVDKLYQRNPILRYTKLALRAPLLALPYGHSQSIRAKDKGYGTFQEEAIRIFSSLQEQESVADPIPVIQGILQTCHDLKPLRDEVFCQLLKQTTSVPDIDSIGNLKNWQVIVCMCCTFIPSRKILRYLRSHLRRSRDYYPDTEMAKFATFCLECIKRTRPREFPPSRAEIIACLGRRDLAAIVYTFGEGAHCKIEINSATTAGAVVRQLCKGLNITQEDNLFGLFEKCGSVEKHIEGRTVVADVLAKFERYKALRLNEKGQRWQLYFKIFCFLNPSEVATDSVEGLFLFEQFCENVAQGRFPAAENIVCRLASLRLQYTKGDYEPGAWVDNMSSVFPVQKIKRLRDRSSSKANSLGREKMSGTLIGSIRKVVSPLVSRGLSEEAEEKAIEEAEQKAESSYIKSSICDYWKGHQGMTCQEAQEQYIEILQKWHGYCSTLFDVKSTNANFPPELWLGVSLEGIAVYKRYESRAITTCEYEYILSFGAPQSNTYKIIAEGRGEMVFETSQVVEIAKLMKAYINEIVRRRTRQQQLQ